jgi:hypothetical protein
LDVEQVALPEMAYDVTVKMPSEELQRVCRDLSAVGENGRPVEKSLKFVSNFASCSDCRGFQGYHQVPSEG